MLGNMVACWHRILEQFDCRVVLSECIWATTERDEVRLQLQVDGHVYKRAPRALGFKVLGAQVSFDQSAAAAINRCFSNAWAAFSKHRSILCSHTASPARRFHLLERFVRPVVMFAIGSLNLTRRHLRQFRGLHFRMLRKILSVQRPPEVPLEDYMRHTADRVNRTMDSTGISWWDDRALKTVHSWAGHLGRMSIYDPARWVYRALQFRNRHYLLQLEEAHGSQCHGRRFCPWRWEHNFYGYYGADWIAETIRNDDWAASFRQWVHWRKVGFNSRKAGRGRGVKIFRVDLEAVLACVVMENSETESSQTSSSSSSGTS